QPRPRLLPAAVFQHLEPGGGPHPGQEVRPLAEVVRFGGGREEHVLEDVLRQVVVRQQTQDEAAQQPGVPQEQPLDFLYFARVGSGLRRHITYASRAGGLSCENTAGPHAITSLTTSPCTSVSRMSRPPKRNVSRLWSTPS